ncbi:MAG: hypothetical protein HZA54_08120 [Planctomycetes bacterium]|nr:hypothetical protein [Planctomycetota bacterium]
MESRGRSDQAQASVEYLILLSGIAVLVLLALKVFGLSLAARIGAGALELAGGRTAEGATPTAAANEWIKALLGWGALPALVGMGWQGVRTWKKNLMRRRIEEFYDLVVRQSLAEGWTTGWGGNMGVTVDKVFPGYSQGRRGKCYEWAIRIAARLEEAGLIGGTSPWDVKILQRNVGSVTEHSAVLVEDGRGAEFVLDPWQTGTAKIYSVHDFLKGTKGVQYDYQPGKTQELAKKMEIL